MFGIMIQPWGANMIKKGKKGRKNMHKNIENNTIEWKRTSQVIINVLGIGQVHGSTLIKSICQLQININKYTKL